MSPCVTEVGKTEMLVLEDEVMVAGVLVLDGALLASPE